MRITVLCFNLVWFDNHRFTPTLEGFFTATGEVIRLFQRQLGHWYRDTMAVIFPDDIFKCIFMNEVVWISIKTSLKFLRDQLNIGIDTNIEVIVVSLTTWEAHHSPRAKPEGCGELPRSLMRQQWPKLRYQFLFYHDETKLMINKQTLAI